MLFFKVANNSKQLFIVDLVIILNSRVFLRKEDNRTQNTLLIVLREYSTGYKVRGISFQDSFLSLVEQAESQSRGNSLLQSLKSILTFKRLVKDSILLRQVDQQSNYLRIALNETAVEVVEAVKLENVSSRSRSLLFKDSPNLLGIYLKPVSANDQAEELSLSNKELAFRQLSIESYLSEALQDFADVFFVFFLGLTINQDIVKVCRIELVEVVVERVVNKPLEGRRGPSQSEWHNQGFEQSKADKEHSQLFVFFFYSYVIKRRNDVDL